MKATIALVTFLPFTPTALAWGALGHETIAYIATNFVSFATKSYCQKILGDTTTSYLANVATWADTYRETAAGKYSAPYHFIDALDNPPSSCGVVYARDCGAAGCVVEAINNYTTRVQDTSLAPEQIFEALKFIIHFVGDVHQPLHDENLDVGGNDIDVKFNGTSTNLHAVWDTNIPETYANGYSLTDAQSWASTVTTAIKTGKYADQKARWISSMSISNAIVTATAWAADANGYVCTNVIPNGASAVENVDLDGAYYTEALPVVQLQFAKAGYRLAAWLNLIATGSTGF